MSQSTKPHGGRSFWALAVLLLAHALPVGLLVSRPDAGSEAWDQNFHHAVLVSRFAQTWDRPDFTNYPSATSPGYHYLLGLVSRAGLVPTESLRELYPWTAPEIEQSEMVRRSRLAQGMSQWIDSGQETILLQIEQDGSGGVARESVERVRGGLCDGEDAEGLARDFGPVGTAMVCRARGDLPGEWAAMDRYRQVLMPLRVVQLLASLAALTVIWLVATRLGLSSWAAAAVALPAAWNPYVLAGGAWITTDCIAMLCASLVLFDVVGNAQRERPPGWLAAGG
ncbi:MAG: hypothetical protein O2819_01630, partial [Planctomycetota bacterium]|nr:hypothetical protein [Planctomycetota bacterium]